MTLQWPVVKQLNRSKYHLCFAFSALMLLVGWQEDNRPVKTEWWGTGVVIYLLSGVRCKWFAYGSAVATVTPSSLAPVKSRMIYPSGAILPRLSWRKRLLNGCSSSSSCCCGLGWVEGSMCYMGTQWRNLVNTYEPSVCISDVALCWITLITCFVLKFVDSNCKCLMLINQVSYSLHSLYVWMHYTVGSGYSEQHCHQGMLCC